MKWNEDILSYYKDSQMFVCDWVVRKKQNLFESGPQAQSNYDGPEKQGLGIWPSLGRDWAVWVNPLCVGVSTNFLLE
jgi:hypothetical protein